MVEKIKFTKQLWKDFLDMAVDSSGSSGWKWFEEKYGFTSLSFEKFLLENQDKVDKWDEVVKNPNYIEETENALKSLRKENKLFYQKFDDIFELHNKCRESSDKIIQNLTLIDQNNQKIIGNVELQNKLLSEKLEIKND